MNGIIPLGYSRVSQPQIAYRGLWGMQSQTSNLSNLESQLMTQQQFQYGSESSYQASRTINIQMLLERKAQSVVNLTTTQSFLSASDSSLSQVGEQATSAKEKALAAVQTTTSATQRDAFADEVKQIVQATLGFANTQFLDRYLFSGSSTTTQPFVWQTDSYTVKYMGNETELNTWGDLNILTQSNNDGVAVFGAVSDAVRSIVDLNPSLQPETLLSSLNGGQGVALGKIRISYELNGKTTSSDIDLSHCATVDDVRKAIVKNSPVGAVLNVDLTDNAFRIGLSPGAGGSIAITDIGAGQTAKMLGIESKTPVAAGTFLTGRDLNPAVTQTTKLDDLCGSKARTYLHFAGGNNDLIIQAAQNGESVVDSNGKTWDMNGVEIAIISNASVTPGNENATYDETLKRIAIYTNPDLTSAQGIADAINRAAENGTIPPFTASFDAADQTGKNADAGMAPFAPGTPVVVGKTAYGSGEAFDRTGMQIVNDNKTHLLDFSESATVGDLLNELNDEPVGLMASINGGRTGIDVRTRISGADFEIGENGGATATQLGIRTFYGGTQLSELDYGRGVEDYDGPGTNAFAKYASASPNSGLMINAKEEGTAANDYKINFIPTNDPEGKVLVSWNQDEKVVNIGINSGVTTACEIVQAFNEQTGPRDLFEMTLDGTDGTNTGTGVVYEGSTKTAEGTNGGVDFVITRNDGVSFEVDIHGAKTIQDVLDIINNHPDNKGNLLAARVAEFGNGIELIDASIGENATRVERTLLGTASIALGLVNEGEEYRVQTYSGAKANVVYDSGNVNSALIISGNCVGEYANDVKIAFVDNVANGAPNSTGFQWDSASKTLTFEIDAGITTANDAIALFKNHASEELRMMFDFQNGWNGDGSISDGSGLISPTSTENTPVLSGGENAALQGNDPNPLEAKSLFTALLRLQSAMEQNDVREIERAAKLLEQSSERVAYSRVEIGVRQQRIDAISTQLANENVQLQESLRIAFGIDETETIVNYSNSLVAYEASLKVTGQLFQLSLLNYV
ncbi:MAG: hypothetical protein LBT05_07385 [Planctomycetaceae bacterium]|jgi:flagellin-like hook-associated protein FlgL|nr:hypothetical protein [Planctomycetaceae bacterium]